MTARDALDMLNRKLAAGRELFPDPKGAVWPLDHVDIAAGERSLEKVTVPPGDDEVIICDFWPACGCAGNCDDAARKPLPRWVWPAWFGVFALCLFAAWLASRWSAS